MVILKGLRVYLAEGDAPPTEVPPPSRRKYRSQRRSKVGILGVSTFGRCRPACCDSVAMGVTYLN